MLMVTEGINRNTRMAGLNNYPYAVKVNGTRAVTGTGFGPDSAI
jgi:hypothetical protein